LAKNGGQQALATALVECFSMGQQHNPNWINPKSPVVWTVTKIGQAPRNSLPSTTRHIGSRLWANVAVRCWQWWSTLSACQSGGSARTSRAEQRESTGHANPGSRLPRTDR